MCTNIRVTGKTFQDPYWSPSVWQIFSKLDFFFFFLEKIVKLQHLIFLNHAWRERFFLLSDPTNKPLWNEDIKLLYNFQEMGPKLCSLIYILHWKDIKLHVNLKMHVFLIIKLHFFYICTSFIHFIILLSHAHQDLS